MCESYSTYLYVIVSFIPYFRLLVFGILVTLVAWFSFHFFPSCPSCLAKCKQRLRNIFVTSSPKVTKNKKRKMGLTKHLSLKKELNFPLWIGGAWRGRIIVKWGFNLYVHQVAITTTWKKMDSKTGKLVYRELFFRFYYYSGKISLVQ